jgi:hypothetical protein
MFRGAISVGTHEKDCAVKGVPHHGQVFKGAGARLSMPVL